mgnify:CR=1 FL=1
MSYTAVIGHIQEVLNKCGDPVVFITTGNQAPHDSGQMSIEIHRAYILRQNQCCTIPQPTPMCSDNPPDKYCVNRIRISQSLADDYSKGYPMTDEEIKNTICTKTFLFGCYE